MKKKTGVYLVIGIVGIALALVAGFILQDSLSDSQSGAMIGIGAGLASYADYDFWNNDDCFLCALQHCCEYFDIPLCA